MGQDGLPGFYGQPCPQPCQQLSTAPQLSKLLPVWQQPVSPCRLGTQSLPEPAFSPNVAQLHFKDLTWPVRHGVGAAASPGTLEYWGWLLPHSSLSILDNPAFGRPEESLKSTNALSTCSPTVQQPHQSLQVVGGGCSHTGGSLLGHELQALALQAVPWSSDSSRSSTQWLCSCSTSGPCSQGHRFRRACTPRSAGNRTTASRDEVRWSADLASTAPVLPGASRVWLCSSL